MLKSIKQTKEQIQHDFMHIKINKSKTEQYMYSYIHML